jgi:SAM-dependent methyltransferase
MSCTAYDMKAFYQTRAGRLVRRILTDRIRPFWPDQTGLNIVGFGYAVPFLPMFDGMETRVNALMPKTIGVHQWPVAGQVRVALTEDAELPLETESVDRVLMVHALEHAENPDAMMAEIWRVLKSNGRVLMIVPHRVGLWARADWTPFGHGTPFTASQLRSLLQAGLFVQERADRALFMPPFKSFMALRTAYQAEAVGRIVFPGLAGVHIVEATKQVYAGTLVNAARNARGRRMVLVNQPMS